jgi:sulfite reductase beta subunit-like hemoprotein
MTINTIIYKKLGGAYASSRLRLYGYSRDTFVRGNPYRERPSTMGMSGCGTGCGCHYADDFRLNGIRV